MDIRAIKTSYARWAPIYDKTFGIITQGGRRSAVEYVNTRSGSVLEVGVGTGLALRYYRADLEVTGVDYSEEMLSKARAKVRDKNLGHVKGLHQMDARKLDFPDSHFDTVVAMHVLSVVPEPEKVMAEIARVCKPGGKVVVTNHFARSKGFLATIGRITAPLANNIGWHSDFEIGTILQEERLTREAQRSLPPLGMMTFLVLGKSETPEPA